MTTAMTSARGAGTLPPLSRAHQEGLRTLISQLHGSGQDVTLLTQLAESLPRLRAGLSAAERQRIEELDSNESALTSALNSAQDAIGALDALLGEPDQALTFGTLLVDPVVVQRIAAAAQLLAESATDLALRANARAELLS